jgi:DNA-binding CsgD family transcriptional regulator
MQSPSLKKKRRMYLTDQDPLAGVEELVRRLAKLLETNGETAALRPSTSGEEVILDVQVDGMRCLLLRVPLQPARAAFYLSPREREIARMVAHGYPNKTIACVLEISSWTVGTYLRRIFAKLSVGSRAAMVARLMEEQLLKDDGKLPVR